MSSKRIIESVYSFNDRQRYQHIDPNNIIGSIFGQHYREKYGVVDPDKTKLEEIAQRVSKNLSVFEQRDSKAYDELEKEMHKEFGDKAQLYMAFMAGIFVSGPTYDQRLGQEERDKAEDRHMMLQHICDLEDLSRQLKKEFGQELQLDLRRDMVRLAACNSAAYTPEEVKLARRALNETFLLAHSILEAKRNPDNDSHKRDIQTASKQCANTIKECGRFSDLKFFAATMKRFLGYAQKLLGKIGVKLGSGLHERAKAEQAHVVRKDMIGDIARKAKRDLTEEVTQPSRKKSSGTR